MKRTPLRAKKTLFVEILMDKVIDLRSDTITRPTEEMWKAMDHAELGDMVLGDDPTLLRLEKLAAEKVGKEAAIFCASGTMANLCAGLAHTQRGDEVIIEEMAHLYHYECGALAAYGGVSYRGISSNFGVVDPEKLDALINPGSDHAPRTTLVWIENTHNLHAGNVLTPDDIRAVSEVCRMRGVKLHLDGARIFNASVYLGIDVRELTRHVDSVTFCLSKGLSAPVGSMLCGEGEFIEKAKFKRKSLGGGLRQAGVIAAAGIVALEKMTGRLADDHANARALADGIRKIKGLHLDPDICKTNIFYVNVKDTGKTPEQFVKELKDSHKVLVLPKPPERIRIVTNRHFETKDVERVVGAIKEVARTLTK